MCSPFSLNNGVWERLLRSSSYGEFMAKPESIFWKEVKSKLKDFSLTRLESWASAGVPDVLAYNKKGTFFTIELKVTVCKKIRFSPHQISFHMRHPTNTFVLAKVLGPSSSKLCHSKPSGIKLYAGAQVETLSSLGHEPVAPIAESWTAVLSKFKNL